MQTFVVRYSCFSDILPHPIKGTVPVEGSCQVGTFFIPKCEVVTEDQNSVTEFQRHIRYTRTRICTKARISYKINII